jgi:hypothetical protein
MQGVQKVKLKPAALQAALRKTTETLAAELARPTRIVPAWSDFEWTIARAAAAMHGVSPLLSRTLRWNGPASWREFLDQQHTHTANRHVRIVELLQRIDQSARREGIMAVALKGAALHALGVYAPGERPMADIDLLVRPQDAGRAARMLESLGYVQSQISWKETVFTPVDGRAPGPLGEHSDNDIKIELHDRICERLPRRFTDVTKAIFPGAAQPGLNAYPSQASLMTHLLLHAAGGMAFQSLRLIHVHDLALLSARMSGADWDEVLHADAGMPRWWMFPPLKLTSMYYPSTIPLRVLAGRERACPWLLAKVSSHKTLCDVSYSHLWIDAFPGIEWCRSATDLAGYVVARVRPSAQHIAERQAAAKTQLWAAQGAWPRLSQSRRILRWVMSRPTRPPTMHVVNAAVEQVH